MNFPQMYKIRQEFPRLGINDIKSAVRSVLSSSDLKNRIGSGARVGITAGSRGINSIDLILQEVVSYVKSCGGMPVLLAAMGSHGGGSPAGQRKILNSLGITEEKTGAPVICSTDCIVIGQAFYGDIYLIREALECDAVIAVNRIKPHTSFHGDFESGLLKMLAVGLGGPPGAASLHRCQPHLLSKAVEEAGKAVLNVLPVSLGLAILEDAYDEVRKIVAIQPEVLSETEKTLLNEARSYLPGLPVSELDVLIVDEIGKNFSGTGMDTNVIGRLRIEGSPEPALPRIKRIVVLDLAREAHGNAYGIGLADFATSRLVRKMDRKAVYLNALTSTFVRRAMIPMTFPSDREAIWAALVSTGTPEPEKSRLIRIHNTLHLSEMLVSESVFQEISSLPHIHKIAGPGILKFNSKGNLAPF
ncbi:MAG: hypothetical protein HPY89_12435 [Pelotomaculum sp.]|uniref:LarA-like N-terminal domain-containing protein n=1 Tax=Pelotomaculum thermopropionicum (strain DSM 13744 / JCM 10971 / SI) TaxID=370438 RepID=A5D2N0_PELTS|nr:hypothetical protein [Pelotomaculum sp.]BAF59514.1 hypothetical protein PTH_1333 [Pelotomaculum thermopropionicum SI]